MGDKKSEIMIVPGEYEGGVQLYSIQTRIFTFRGVQVMLDRDLASLYHVTTSALNQAVKRNIKRFPERFMFQLTKEEFENWKSQIVISNIYSQEELASLKMGARKYPNVLGTGGRVPVSRIIGVINNQ